jgi:hypothetical protein
MYPLYANTYTSFKVWNDYKNNCSILKFVLLYIVHIKVERERVEIERE